jgi:integrase
MARRKYKFITLNKKTGMYESRIELPSIDGSRRRLVRRSKNDPEGLEAYHLAKLQDLKKYGDLPSASPTLEVYLPKWLGEKAQHARPNTMTNYRSVVNAHIVPIMGKKRLARITPVDIKALHRAILDKGLSSTYALNAHRVLSTALSDAMADGLIMTNPAKRTRAPRKGRPRLEAFTLAESQQLLRYVLEHEPDGARWAMALLTGARRGEVIGLEVDRVAETIDLSWQLQRIGYVHGCKKPCGKRPAECPQKTINVPSDYERIQVEGGLYLTRPKSSDGWRIVPLVHPLSRILDDHINAKEEPGRFVFDRPDGRPIDPSADTKRWREVLRASGIEKDVRLHDLRHTAVDLLLSAGVPPETVRLIVGHSTDAQTLAYASRANADARLRTAMEAMGSLLTPRMLEQAE